MKKNSAVVCVDDQFDPWVYDLYTDLPKKGQIYTIRHFDLGRTDPVFGLDEDANLSTVHAERCGLVLLHELRNPDDPHGDPPQELGFRSDRFAPLTSEQKEETREVENPLVVPDLVPS